MPCLALALATEPWYVATILLYRALSVTWIWILTAVQLPIAYPFIALSFVIPPLLAYLVFYDPFGFKQIANLSATASWIFLISSAVLGQMPCLEA